MDLRHFNEKEILAECLFKAFPGILVAAAVYSLCLVAGFMVHGFFQSGLPTLGVEWVRGLVELVLGVILVGLLIGFASFFFCLLAMLFVAPAVVVVNRTLGDLLDGPSVAVTIGSLTGFLCLLLVVAVPQLSQAELRAILLGPVLASMMGAIGAWWGLQKKHVFRLSDIKIRPLKLSVSQLLVMTFWFAVLFAVSNLCATPLFTVACLGWLLLNTLYVGVFRRYRRHLQQIALR